jgi:hypothetical protein
MRLLPGCAGWGVWGESASVLVAMGSLTLAACAGKVVNEGSPDEARDAGRDDGPAAEDVVIIDVVVPPPYDALASPPPEDAPYIEDVSVPVTCSAPTGNACFDCLATSCCPQLGACEDDPECNQALACFQGCYVPGQGAACSSKCNSQFPAPEEGNLTSCGAMQCQSCD